MINTAHRPSPVPTVIGRCAVAGCTNSARLRISVVPEPAHTGCNTRPVTAAGLVCQRHARQTELGAVLVGSVTEGDVRPSLA